MLATLIVALLLQVAGSAIVVWEVHEAHRRWQDKFGPRHITGSLNITLPVPRAFLTGHVVTEPTASVEERLDMLEAGQRRAHETTARELNRLEHDVIPTAVRTGTHDVEARLEPQIADTVTYLAGLGERSRWLPWWLGPLLLLLGTLLAGIAGIAAAV